VPIGINEGWNFPALFFIYIKKRYGWVALWLFFNALVARLEESLSHGFVGANY